MSLERVTSMADLRELARRRVPSAIFEYADRGSYDEITLRRNRADLDAIELRQRVMIDLSKLSLATTVLGQPWSLPVGIAPERGLQVKTILVARSISVLFPEIQNIGGVRPDALRWHPDGLALDVMIPNPSSAEGIALGNRIVEFALENADRFDLQDCIWRGMYYTPSGAKAGGYGHYDHVHITTHGGGYPTGGEVYIR